MAAHPKARQYANGFNGGYPVDIAEFVARFGNSLLANARRHCASAQDADDAYQRALEILLTKTPETDGLESLAAWMHTVVRNESLQIQRRRRHELNTDFDEITENLLGEAPPVDEGLVETVEVGLGREALNRINPDQTRCLLLRADGLGYPEICATTGFSYAKVNRLISEGRKALRVQVGLIESGVECRRLYPLLSLVADGEAFAAQHQEVDPHLANCLTCQATLREMRAAPKSLKAAMPLGVFSAEPATNVFERLADQLGAAWANLQERVAAHFGPAAANGSDVLTAKKIAAATAIAAALAGGGVAVERAVDEPRPPAAQRSVPPALLDRLPVASTTDVERRRTAARERRAEAARERDAVSEREVLPAEVGESVPETEPSAEPLGTSLPEGGDQTAADDPGGSNTQLPELAP